MRLQFSFLLFLICMVLMSCKDEKKGPIEGVWQLVSTKPLKPDGSIDSLSPDDWQMMKIISKSHFLNEFPTEKYPQANLPNNGYFIV